MVISRTDAKKRRKEEEELEDVLPGSPKRTKVHAQRKFAQGSSNLSSPALTPVKDKDKVRCNGAVVSPDIIPSNRPKTEDFLTFLCFRGTSILPSHLDFFNTATYTESVEEEINEVSPAQPVLTIGLNRRSDRLETHPQGKKTATAVQALKKKYKEQRFARQRAANLKKLAQRVKGKNMIRTRSTTLKEESKTTKVKIISGKADIFPKQPVKLVHIARRIRALNRRLPVKRVAVHKSEVIRRVGLRSGGLPSTTNEQIVRKEHMKPKNEKSLNKGFHSTMSDFSSDDDKPLVKKVGQIDQKKNRKQQLARRVVKRIVHVHRRARPQIITRSRQQEIASVSRPTRKTKEAATVYMEMLGKKLASVDMDQDEDSLSIDSFPELPNARKLEQREIEIRSRNIKSENHKEKPKGDSQNVIKINKKQIHLEPKVSDKTSVMKELVPKVKLTSSKKLKFSGKRKPFKDKVGKTVRILTRNQRLHKEKKNLSRKCHESFVEESKKKLNFSKSSIPKQNKQLSSEGRKSNQKCSSHSEHAGDIDDKFSDSDEEPLGKIATKINLKGKIQIQKKSKVSHSESVVETRQRSGKKVFNFKNVSESSLVIDKKSVLVNRNIGNASTSKAMKTSSLKTTKIIKKTTTGGKIIMKGSKAVPIKSKLTKNMETVDVKTANCVKVEYKTKEKSSVGKSATENKVLSEKKLSRTPVKQSQCSLPEETEVEIQRRLSLVSLKDSAKDSLNFEEYTNTSSNIGTNVKESISKSLKKSNFKQPNPSPDNSFVNTSSVNEIKCTKHIKVDTSLTNKTNSKNFTEIRHDLQCTQNSEFLTTNDNVKHNLQVQCSIKETQNILETSIVVSDFEMDSNVKVSKAVHGGKEMSNLHRKNIGNDKSVLDEIDTELCKDNLIIVNTADNVLPGFDLSQENKGKMSTERIEKWLSESCSGTIEHKSDCPVFSSSLCKCMSAAEDDEYFEKLSIEGYSKRQYFSDISEQEMLKLENIREGRHKTKLVEFEVSETLEKDSYDETKRPDIKQQPVNFGCSGETSYETNKIEILEEISTSSYQTPKISDCISKKNLSNKNEYYELESVDEYCANKTRRSKVCKMEGSAGNKSKVKVPTTPEKKAIFNQRRTFTHKGRQKKELVPSVNAFSPENESSVYAFECDADPQPVKTPFRRQARDSRTSSSTTSKSEEDLPKLLDESLPSVLGTSPSIQSKAPVNCSVLENVNSVETQCGSTKEESQTAGKISASTKSRSNRPRETTVAAGIQTDSYSPVFVVPDDVSTPVTKKEHDNVITNSYWQTSNETVRHEVSKQSTSIAVQVNLDSDPDSGAEQETPQRSMEISTQTEGAEEEDDEEGHLFYIPLQGTETADGNSSSRMIQGVAVKLGTEGPNGPNQRVIMRAKLVTKPPSFSSTAVSRSVLGTSSAQKTTPVGTVQPTARSKPIGSAEPSVSKERRSSVEQPAVPTTKNSPSTSRRISQKSKCVRAVDPSFVLSPVNVTKFPNKDGNAQLVQAPTFHPTEKEFQDPLEFIDKIRPVAEKFGLCRVVPPPTFKPECKVSDDMRFTAYNQYVHKMLHRWGPNVKEMMAIKKYLATQSISLTNPPWVGGMEVDLPRLYQTVQTFGGLKEVIEKKRWHRVADSMRIAKSAQDRVTKLDDIYCKYLLPYDTLSPDERQKLFDEVEKEWEQRDSRGQHCDTSSASDAPEDDSDDAVDDNEECIVKGRSMPLSTFYRIARNTMAMWFKQTEPPSAEVEQEFWRHVMTRQSHVCVHSGSIDSSGWGYGFPVSKNSPFARHPWNLKVLTNNSGSVLRSLGPVMGVTVPTLHVGMLFTTCCWYRDPHGLPWIEYLHTGASKIWYGIPDSQSSVFRTALMKLLPKYCRSRTIWLPSDTAMVPPPLLVENGVSLCHTVQDPGQFIVVFPRAFTSSISTGYLVSESVYFAQPSWLETAEQGFKDIHESCEPSMFSLEKLIFSIANDTRSSFDVLKQVLPMIIQVREKEIQLRKQLCALGLKTSERLPLPERKKSRSAREEEGDYECEICRANLFLSLVTNSHEEGVYCLPHAIELLTKKKHHLKFCKLMYTYDQSELNEIVQKAQERMELKKGQKKGAK